MTDGHWQSLIVLHAMNWSLRKYGRVRHGLEMFAVHSAAGSGSVSLYQPA